MFLAFTVIPLVGFLLVLTIFITMMATAMYYFIRVIGRNGGGGWGTLSEHYSAPDHAPNGYHITSGRTVQVGYVVAKRCATIGIGPQGLYLKAQWRKAVLIPWSEIREITPTTLYWRQAVSLSIGDPTVAKITAFQEDFDAMRPYLSQHDAEHPINTPAVSKTK